MIGRPAFEGRASACRRSCECRDGRVGVLVQADELEVGCKSAPAGFLAVRLARRVAARLPLGCDRLASPLSAPVAASTLVRQLQWMLCLRLPAAEARPSNMSWLSSSLSSSSLHLTIWQLALLD